MTTNLTLASTSRATDAGWRAAADIAQITTELDAPYRLVGGLAVTLIVHAHGAERLAPERETADADLGVPMDVCGDARLLDGLLAAGYTQQQGNRFVRSVDGHDLVIDVLAPSYQGRLVSNQPHGSLIVDEVPGLQAALALPPTVVDITAVLTDGTTTSMTLNLPDVSAALIMKALAYRGRLAASDEIDIHRLLETALHAGRTIDNWPTGVEARDASQILHQFFAGHRASAALGRNAGRVRLLTSKLVPLPSAAATGRKATRNPPSSTRP